MQIFLPDFTSQLIIKYWDQFLALNIEYQIWCHSYCAQRFNTDFNDSRIENLFLLFIENFVRKERPE